MADQGTRRVGLIGAGSMGSLHARVVSSGDRSELAWVIDHDRERAREVSERYGAAVGSIDDLSGADAIVVASPTESHFEIACDIINAGIPLLLEKPLADTFQRSAELIELARRQHGVLMCGFLERFNAAVRTAFEIAREPIFATTVRHSPYAERIRTGVTPDLLIHDADAVVRLFDQSPDLVSGQVGAFDGRSLEQSEDIAQATLVFSDKRMASLSASRVSQRKVRSMTIAELDRLIEVDLLRQDITIFRNIATGEFDEHAGFSHQAIIDIPEIRHQGEPLRLLHDHFLDLIDGRADSVAELDTLLLPHSIVDAVLTSSASSSMVAPPAGLD